MSVYLLFLDQTDDSKTCKNSWGILLYAFFFFFLQCAYSLCLCCMCLTSLILFHHLCLFVLCASLRTHVHLCVICLY